MSHGAIAVYDWYQATIPQDAEHITEVFSERSEVFGHEDLERGLGRGYSRTRVFKNTDDDTVGILLYGSKTARPSLRVSGEGSDPLAHHIRQRFPDHSVSRCDLAYDKSAKGGFRRAVRAISTTAKSYGVKSGRKILPLDDMDPTAGKTIMVGSPSSEVSCRIYEKGKEMLAKRRITLDDFDPDHFRVEFQFRPSKAEEKRRFASMDPVWVMGWSKWVKEVGTSFLKLDLPDVERLPHQTSDIDRTMAFVQAQYAKTFRKFAEVENRRSVGLTDPSKEDLMDILMDTLRERIMYQWDVADEIEAERAAKD